MALSVVALTVSDWDTCFLHTFEHNHGYAVDHITEWVRVTIMRPVNHCLSCLNNYPDEEIWGYPVLITPVDSFQVFIIIYVIVINYIIFIFLLFFLILRLGAPTGILRGGSPVFKRFGPLNLLTFSGGGGASGD